MALAQRQHPVLLPLPPSPCLLRAGGGGATAPLHGHSPLEPALLISSTSPSLQSAPNISRLIHVSTTSQRFLAFKQASLGFCTSHFFSYCAFWDATKPSPLSSMSTADPFKHHRKKWPGIFFKNKGEKWSLLTQIHLEVEGGLQHKSSLQLSLPPDKTFGLAPNEAR